jgi:hypothetical protein
MNNFKIFFTSVDMQISFNYQVITRTSVVHSKVIGKRTDNGCTTLGTIITQSSFYISYIVKNVCNSTS